MLPFVLGIAASARAAEDEPKVNGYSIENITVDADGKDIEDARSRALLAGESEAFRQFVIRVSPAKSSDIITKASAQEISNMISGFEVMEEKVTPDHYHATLRYNFIPQNINALLPDLAKAKFSSANNVEHQSKAVIVLPLYNEGKTLKLWQDDNKWRNIWLEAALESGGGIVVVPIGDIDDRVDIDDTNIEKATSESLKHMYVRYGVSDIYIMEAFFDKKADPKPTLQVAVKKLLKDKNELSHMEYIIRTSDTIDILMARAANDIAKHLYKLQTINPNKIEFERLKEINARVNTSDIHEWENLRKRLLAHGNIVGIKLTSISFYETSMIITFRGTPDMLGKTLVASGLRVMQDGDSLVLVLK